MADTHFSGIDVGSLKINGVDVTDNVTETTREITATGAVPVGAQSVELNSPSASIAAVIADSANNPGVFMVKQTDAGTEGHTLTLTAGTFDGTNNVATLDAANEALVVYFDSAGDGTILANVGSVTLS